MCCTGRSASLRPFSNSNQGAAHAVCGSARAPQQSLTSYTILREIDPPGWRLSPHPSPVFLAVIDPTCLKSPTSPQLPEAIIMKASLKQSKSRVLFLLAPAVLCTACQTTGDPRQGGLFGWSP